MKKIITFAIVIFMLFALLISCGKNNEESVETSETTETVETEETSEDTEPEETTDDSLENVISIFKDGQSEFTIVQPESSDNAVSKAGTSLKNAIKKQGATTVNFYKEEMYKTIHNGSIDGSKIIIGALEDDKISQDIFESFNGYYYHYTIKVSGDSLYIIGGSAEATVNAINYFIDTYLSEKITSLNIAKDTDITVTPEPPISNLTINGNSIYDYSIVYFQSYYAEQAAYNIQETLIKTVGKSLPVIADSVNNPETELEILVGKTSRDESKAVRAEYDRPNVYYDIVEANDKLVMMGEGYTTLETVYNKLNEYLGTLDTEANIVGTAVHGNVLSSDNMLERADGTELRVMAWNMGGPSVTGRIDLWEKQIDVILMHLPDVWGSNEYYAATSSTYKPHFEYVWAEISEYYTIIESPVDDTYGTPNPRYGAIPQNIFIRKGSGISLSLSGYQLLAPGDSLHGIHWAILEKEDGSKFIYSIGHYTSSHDDTTCPTQHANLLKQAQQMSGSSEILPAIISGDLFMNYGNTGYKVLPEAGYKDAQREALVNANNDISHGTFHNLGEVQPGRAEIDLIFYNAGFEALKHKVIVMVPARDSSDHCPVVTDLRF